MNSLGGFDEEDKGRFPAAFVLGLVIVALVVLAIVLASHSTHPAQPGHQPKLPFDAADQAYAPNIHFGKLALAESSNLLGQKFTYVGGIITNGGSRAIKALEIKVEFHDPFNQVILRETHRVISESDKPLAPGQQQAFNLTFDGVPVEWNRQNPTIQVTGLVLQ